MKKYDPLFEAPPTAKIKKSKKIKIVAKGTRILEEERLDITFAKSELKKAFEKFKKKGIKKYGKLLLNDYLPEGEEDPFLAEMTFKQLMELNLDFFLAKRSINNIKIKNILLAFDKVTV